MRVVWVWLRLSVGVVAADDHVDQTGEVLPLQELDRPLPRVRGADGDLDPVVLGVVNRLVKVGRLIMILFIHFK